ncbi:hypothetical protein ACIRBX_04440 [Kitasatospora sp. NPDC096147]|uniref:hypothetical protein n=1 Tax=Kitasatospora sp. NPDC096147 TaxID=3364093 RepID=UPI003811D94D
MSGERRGAGTARWMRGAGAAVALLLVGAALYGGARLVVGLWWAGATDVPVSAAVPPTPPEALVGDWRGAGEVRLTLRPDGSAAVRGLDVTGHDAARGWRLTGDGGWQRSGGRLLVTMTARAAAERQGSPSVEPPSAYTWVFQERPDGRGGLVLAASAGAAADLMR